MINRNLIGLLITSLASLNVSAVEPSPDDPYRAELGEPLRVEVDFQVAITAPYPTKKLRVWIPVPPSDEVQQYESLGYDAFPNKVEPVFGRELKYGNQFAYFEFDHPQGAQVIRHRFVATTREMRWRVDSKTIQHIAEWPNSFTPYLQSDSAVSVDDELDELLEEVVQGEHSREKSKEITGYGRFSQAVEWVNQNMTYDHSCASLAASSEHALEHRRGHCSDYHGLCAAFGRALNYPTRVTYGLALYPKNSPSHCKLETYLPPYGWVSFDISETQKLIHKIEADQNLSSNQRELLVRAAKKRLLSGFREASWLLVTRGTDYELAPPATKRVKVVRTIYAEADGEPLPEPDPADKTKREFAWMTAHRYVADKPVEKPFKDWECLE